MRDKSICCLVSPELIADILVTHHDLNVGFVSQHLIKLLTEFVKILFHSINTDLTIQLPIPVSHKHQFNQRKNGNKA